MKQQRVVIYTRSNADPEYRPADIEAQQRLVVEQLDAAYGPDGWTVAADYEDHASSMGRRAGYEALVRDIRAGEVDVLAVASIDRPCRRVTELETLKAALKAAGAQLIVGRDWRAEPGPLLTTDIRFQARPAPDWRATAGNPRVLADVLDQLPAGYPDDLTWSDLAPIVRRLVIEARPNESIERALRALVAAVGGGDQAAVAGALRDAQAALEGR